MNGSIDLRDPANADSGSRIKQHWLSTHAPVARITTAFAASLAATESQQAADPDGVALAAIQGLNEKLEEKDTALAELRAEMEAGREIVPR